MECSMTSFDSTKKLQIYKTIYRLNASFANIVLHCRLLKQFRVLSPKCAHLYQSFAQELQAEINRDVMSVIGGHRIRRRLSIWQSTPGLGKRKYGS